MIPIQPGKPASPLREMLGKHKPLFRNALTFSLIVNMLVLVPTFYMLEVYDRVVTSRNSTTLLMLLLAVIGAYVMMELLEVVRGDLMHKVAVDVDANIRSRLFNGVMEASLRRVPMSSLQPFNDIKTLREFLPSPAFMAMMDAPASLLFLLFVFIISPWLGVLALLGMLISVVIAFRTERLTMPALTEANKAAIEAQSYSSSVLRNAQVIEAMGMLKTVRERWATIQRRFLRLQAEASDHSGLNTAGSRLVQTLQGSIILGASCWLMLKGNMLGGGGMMIVASTLGARVLNPVTQLITNWRQVVNARDAAKRLDELLNFFQEKQPTMALPAPKGNLAAENVIAGPPGSQTPIIKGVSFAVPAGELVVMMGPSAAGKTTMARLLTGIWPAVQGKVRLDGVDVHTWNKDELGPYVGYLPQTVELFDGTIAENIARFGDIDRDMVALAAERAGLGALIEELPEGYETRIGDDGSFLSGGQRQRVALARAIYGSPKLLVLDEPNSSLDEAGEQQLAALLQQLKAEGSTIVAISHRASLWPVADKLLVLNDGRVVLFGPRDEVIAAMQKAAQQQGAGRPAQPAGGAVVARSAA